MFVDSHAHLDSDQFRGDLEEVFARAGKAMVTGILTIGCLGPDPTTEQSILDLTIRDGVWGAVGIHPHDARLFSDDALASVRRLMDHPRIIGLGEIGLDYHYDFSTPEQQQVAFRGQLRVARAANKPVIIHMRESENDSFRVLADEMKAGPIRGVFHCFSSDSSAADQALELGFYLSFGGIVSFKSAGDLRDIAQRVPADRYLIETDCPYLAPVPFRGRRNEPSLVARVAEVLAEVRGSSVQKVASETTGNFQELFGVRV